MCGIVGFVGPRDDAVLERMRDALVHRGPDDAGTFVDGAVSLGHRRLAIVDLQGGRQPLFNEDKTVCVVFNGEIYNHPALRRRLEALGHVYRSSSDTESIVHAYEEYGEHCVDHLDGMFAFVVLDRRRRLLFGARDRMGKKPLYYVCPGRQDEGGVRFAFASELKALRAHPAIERGLELSLPALATYLANDYIVGEERIFRSIRLLPAGAAFRFPLDQAGAVSVSVYPYWACDVRPGSRPGGDGNEEGRFVELLRSAVERRLMSDVPLGIFLSGGVDSTSLAATLRDLRPEAPIDAFAIGFDDPTFDESAYAEAAAEAFACRLHHRRFTVGAMLDRLPGVAAMLDEPFADPSILPVSMLCDFAREHVKVALGGDGGDELFAGYDPFRAVHPARWYRALVPKSVDRRIVRPLAGFLPASSANMPVGFRAQRFLRGLAAREDHQLPTWMGAFSATQLKDLVPDLGEAIEPERLYAPMIADYRAVIEATGDPIAAATSFFHRYYLEGDILYKVDRASMLHSLEVRSPFLDTRLVEFAMALPTRLKLARGRTKVLLRRAFRDRIPRSILRRSKKGFGIPVAAWIRGELKQEFERALLREWPDRLGMFRKEAIARLLAEHVSGAANNYKELWALYMLTRWADVHWR